MYQRVESAVYVKSKPSRYAYRTILLLPYSIIFPTRVAHKPRSLATRQESPRCRTNGCDFLHPGCVNRPAILRLGIKIPAIDSKSNGALRPSPQAERCFSARKRCFSAVNLSVTTSQRSLRSARPLIKASFAVISPYVCIRMFIFGSEGCGIEYPQNST